MATPARFCGDYKRFGVFGGSFDPVHVGHLSIAQQILNALKLEQVVLVPAAAPPHKQDGRQMASATDRLEMCKLAVHNMRGLSVSDDELKRGGISYTVETARRLREAYGADAEVFLLIGSDSLRDLPQWYEAQELVRLARFAIAERREAPVDAELWVKLREVFGAEAAERLREGVVPVERVDVSSTHIRELLRRGERIPGYLRQDVEEYIRRRGLYGAAPA